MFVNFAHLHGLAKGEQNSAQYFKTVGVLSHHASLFQASPTFSPFFFFLLSSICFIVQELCESWGGRPGLSVLTNLLVSVDVKIYWTVLRHCHNLSLICQLTSEDIKQHFTICGLYTEEHASDTRLYNILLIHSHTHSLQSLLMELHIR